MRRARSAQSRLKLSHALALGALHGPAELLPVSSSAHTTLVPWLLGWSYPDLDPELRKAFEIALHAGTAAAPARRAARRGRRRRARLDRRALRSWSARSCRPRSSATRSSGRSSGGWARRRRSRPGSPPGRRRCGSPTRARRSGAARTEAGVVDALALGLAQACALVPGVSRNGATLTAARARGFRRADANALSRHVALPVIVGATVLKGVRLARRGLPGGRAGRSRAGVGAAFASTLARCG